MYRSASWSFAYITVIHRLDKGEAVVVVVVVVRIQVAEWPANYPTLEHIEPQTDRQTDRC